MAKSLLEVLRDVSLDPTEQAAYSADPSGYLAQYGYEDVHPDDISEAFSLVADTLPPDQAQTVSESQAAGQFGGGTVGADEGLAANGVPTFGAGYEAEVAEADPTGAAEPVDDMAFGEGVGDAGFGYGEDAASDSATELDAGVTTDDTYDDSGFGEDDAFSLGETDDAGSGADLDGGGDAYGLQDDDDPDFGEPDVDDIGSF